MSLKEFFLLCWYDWRLPFMAIASLYVLACFVFAFKKESLKP